MSTIDRLRGIWPGAGWLIVTTKPQAEAIRACLPEGLRRAVLVEPQMKNTAACITAAAVALARRDPRQMMVVAPADHWIAERAAYRQVIRAAIRAATRSDTIVTIGIRPTYAHPGLGYLCTGARIPGRGSLRLFRLTRFVEKPTTAGARRLIRSRGTYWNSGIFVGTADKFLECITEWIPEHTRHLVPLARRRGRMWLEGAGRAYRALASVSFDHAVMDHLHDGIVVEGRFGWADLGTWDVWARASRGAALQIGVRSGPVRVISQEPHLIATIGVRDLLVVHTRSATLICRPQETQLVRQVVQQLSANARLRRYV